MVVRAIEAGALGYVLKPVTKEALAAMISRGTGHRPTGSVTGSQSGSVVVG
jgi:DNA-binding NarL/FixJ family response regulator